uniref:30S ribosomal protein S17 n=1 Tax=Lygus hesperus TaxID=30085 RepID=A0A0A9XPV7_LYGHE
MKFLRRKESKTSHGPRLTSKNIDLNNEIHRFNRRYNKLVGIKRKFLLHVVNFQNAAAVVDEVTIGEDETRGLALTEITGGKHKHGVLMRPGLLEHASAKIKSNNFNHECSCMKFHVDL